MLGEMGWDLPLEGSASDVSSGRPFKDEAHVIHEHTGYLIDDAWIAGFRDRRDDALRARLQAVPGAVDAVREIAAAADVPVACVSGADRRKIAMQLAMVGLDDLFGDRVFSGMEVPHSKPAPDVYMAMPRRSASTLPQPPSSRTRRPASARVLAAGATVFGFAADGPTYQTPAQLEELGVAHVFRTMAEGPQARSSGRGSRAAAAP